MTANALDRHARKQVLLTRIAFDRTQLRSDLTRLSQASRLSNLLRGVVGGSVIRSLFGAPSPANQGGWVGLALSLFRRYRIAAALIGGAAPIVRGRGGWRRVLRVAGLGAAAWLSWQFIQDRDKPKT
jgi:hypothetical protein